MRAELLIVAICAGMWSFGGAAEDPAFEKASLGWRTALHFDPGAEAPLNSLAQLYQGRSKMNDLLGLYAGHVAQYPADEGAKVVLARLYVRMGDSRAETFLDQAVAQHPANALLVRTRAAWWQSKRNPRALEELDRAVALEVNGARRARWLGDLLAAAALAEREDLLVARFTALAKEGGLTPAQRLQWGRRALEAGLAKTAAAVLAGGEFAGLAGDEGIEARFLLGEVALANGQRAEAATQAAGILERLAADHWRHKEALALRWRAAGDEADRQRLLAEMARKSQDAPQSEAAALAYGDLLVTAEKKEEALKIWREALARFPDSRLLEERVLDLFEQLRQSEGLLEFLGERVRRQPERQDLALRRARTLLLLGRLKEGLADLKTLTADVAAPDAAALMIQTARWLRARHGFGEAAAILEALLRDQAERWDARKELAELYVLLRRQPEMEALFAVEIPAALAPEVRLEVAQFLAGQKLWPQARALLEPWVKADTAEFEGRLLLAKVNFLLGQEAAAAKLLDECRALADTEARYAAWLALAWEQAEAGERTAEFLTVERARLWPKAGETWDQTRLARLSLIAEQTLQPKERTDAEQLLRQALAASDLPAEQRRELRTQLIRVLEGQAGREKALEDEIRAALEEPGTVKGDLQLRLVLMYQRARRPDLAQAALAEVNFAACQDGELIASAAKAAEEMGALEQAQGLYERLVTLQPDERAHWTAWTTMLMEKQDEAGLRLALREIQARSRGWKLSDHAQEQVRRHLAASYWRTVAAILGRHDDADGKEPLRVALTALDELEQLEIHRARQLWAVWARGMVAARLGDEAAVRRALAQLAETKEAWVDFPDGLSLARKEAKALIEAGSLVPTLSTAPVEPASAPAPPLGAAWIFAAPGKVDLQRWDLTADGKAVLVADSRSQLHLIDRATGKLLWQTRLPASPKTGRAAMPMWNPQGGENLQYPVEWALAPGCIGLLGEDGLYGLSAAHGEVMWKSARSGVAGGGRLAQALGKILWWQPKEGRLDAYDAVTGKLLWTRNVNPPWQPDLTNQGNPQWLTAGMHADVASGNVLVWGDGGAVLRVADGSIVWRARAGQQAPSFPLELPSEERAPSSSAGQGLVLPWQALGGHPGMGTLRRYQTPRVIFANTLAVPGYGYPGMYGSNQKPTLLTWGIDDTRYLHGGAIWRMAPGTGQVCSILGLPLAPQASAAPLVPRGPSHAAGFVGRSIVAVSEISVTRYDPVRGEVLLWADESRARRTNRMESPMPAVALTGRTLLLATRDVLRIQDAVSGTTLWEGAWPEDVKAAVAEAREPFKIWQSLRWSSRGVLLNDGQGRTLAVDWKALTAEADWIVPAGTRALVCLRGAGPGVESPHED